jgi:hypothetical protein
MKKMILLTVLLAGLPAAAALAEGVNVSWGNTCWSDAGSTSSLTWACNSNTFTGVRMTTSFQPAVDKTNFRALTVFMEGVTDDATPVPDWWKLGACPGRGLPYASIDTTVLGDACHDPWEGNGIGGLLAYSFDTNRMHMNAVHIVADDVEIRATDDNFALQLRIPATATVGTGLCSGCLVPVTWALNYIELQYSGPEPNEFLGWRMPGGNQCLNWQADPAYNFCERPIPARNSTWGQVKSLYR